MEITFLPYTKNLGAHPEMIITECCVRPANSSDAGTTVNALWDTGANRSMISMDLASMMGLVPLRHINSHSTNGISRKPVYQVAIMLPNGAGLPKLNVVEGHFDGHDIIIGMDIISLHDFALTHNQAGELILSIVFPPLNKPLDYSPLANQQS